MQTLCSKNQYKPWIIRKHMFAIAAQALACYTDFQYSNTLRAHTLPARSTNVSLVCL